MRYRLLAAFLFFSLSGFSQKAFEYYHSNKLKFVDKNNDTVADPFIGGFLSPQFSEIDLDGNGRLDLIVFDRSTYKLYTFINTGTPNKTSFVYAPYYEDFFPKMNFWCLTADYNNDGKMDLFTDGNGGFRVFRNTSTGNTPSFTLKHDLIFDNNGINVYVPNTNIPGIQDIDGDGDLDILSWGPIGASLELYKNFNKELGLNADSMYFKWVDPCWGSFEMYNYVALGITCQKYYLGGNPGHSGSTVLALDMNNDGDKEVIMGDIFYDYLYLLTNGKKDFNYPYDTIIASDSLFPANSRRAEIPHFPAAYRVDADNDGIKDLIIAPNDPNSSANTHQIYFYKNTGTNALPVFTFIKDNFLQETSIDLGMGNAPAFFDYDNDGDDDLVLATYGSYMTTNNGSDRLILYKNLSNNSNPVFQVVDSDYVNLSALSLNGITPAFADFNGDNKKDLVFGSSNGRLHYYSNSGNTPATFNLVSSNWAGVNMGSWSTPTVGDLDKDGKYDLLVGCYDGILKYYRNTGSLSAPAFTLAKDTFGRINIKETYMNFIYDGNGNIIDTEYVYVPQGHSAPFLAELNNNGNLDLIVGDYRGLIHIFKDIQTQLNDSIIDITEIMHNPLLQKFVRRDLGMRCIPSAQLLDGDAYPDLLIGSYSGGVYFYGSMSGNPVGIQQPSLVTSFSAYPNPTNGKIQLQFPNNAIRTVEVYNLLGTLMLQQSATEATNTLEVDLSTFPSGVYFIRSEGAVQKVVKQ